MTILIALHVAAYIVAMAGTFVLLHSYGQETGDFPRRLPASVRIRLALIAAGWPLVLLVLAVAGARDAVVHGDG